MTGISANSLEVSGGAVQFGGGGVGRIRVNAGTVEIVGGVAGDLIANGTGLAEIAGDGFTVNGLPVPFGDLVPLSGTLAGVLASGQALPATTFTRASTATIRLVPEPSTALLLAGGLAGLALRRGRARGGRARPTAVPAPRR